MRVTAEMRGFQTTATEASFVAMNVRFWWKAVVADVRASGTITRMMVALLIAFAPLLVAAHDAADDQQSFSETLWYAAADARGAELCDRRLAKRQQTRFDELYQTRVDRLKQSYFAKHPPDSSFDIILTCRRAIDRRAEQGRLRRALSDFEPKLRALERKYGSY